MAQKFSDEELNAIEIRDDELSELLERISVTDAMFRNPVTTIRDVAELTEVSPERIAQALREIREPVSTEDGEQSFEIDSTVEDLRGEASWSFGIALAILIVVLFCIFAGSAAYFKR